MRRPHPAFSIIELLMVLAILAILAAIVIPKFAASADAGRSQSMASTVRHVRQQIETHAASKDVALSATGFPTTIPATWFLNDEYPKHTWNMENLVIQVVAGGANDWYPATKTFNPAAAGAVNCWYNTTNGAFCALVGAGSNDAQTILRFNEANLCEITVIGQTAK